jgi:hypothetical protein
MQLTPRKLCFAVVIEAIVIAGGVCFWYSVPRAWFPVQPASVEMLGLGTFAKEGNVATFSNVADLDRELGPTRYRLVTPVDFSQHSLIRVGWVPELSSTGALEHTVRFGGLMVLFDVDSWRFDSEGEYHMAEDAWFIVPKFATGAAATRQEVLAKDRTVWIAVAALALLLFVWMTRGSRGRKPEHRRELATSGVPVAAR